MTADSVLVSIADGIATLTINRPDRRNALTQPMLERMLQAIDQIEGDDRTRVLVLKGAGRAFCSGMDLAAMEAARREQGWFDYELLPRVFERLAHHPNPTVAMVQGAAIAGGCELALHCDIRIGSAGARFAMPLARLGLVAPAPAVERLVQTVGLTAARDLLLTGDVIDGVRGSQVGLLTRLVADEALERETEALAGRIAANAPLSVRIMKRMIDRLAPAFGAADAARFDAERIEISRSEDMQEGLRAFFDRRPPVFRGV